MSCQAFLKVSYLPEMNWFMSLNRTKIPTKIAIKGARHFNNVGEAARIRRKEITQMATGNQAAINKITTHLFMGRKIKTRVMIASTMA